MPATRTATALRAAPLITALGTVLGGAVLGMALTTTTTVPGIDEPARVVLVALPIARAVFIAAAVATVGLCLLPLLLRGERAAQADPVLTVALRAGITSALVWAMSALAILVLTTAEFHAPATTIGLAEVRVYVSEVNAGAALLLVAVLAFGLAILALAAVRFGNRIPSEVLTGLGLLALLPVPATGHAATMGGHQILTSVIAVHVLSAVAWTGGLGAMAVLLARNRTLLARSVPRFSVLATGCLFLTAATGVASGLIEIQSVPTMGFTHAMLHTGYGHLLIGKVLCMTALAVVGTRMRFWLLPRIRAHSRTAFTGWATLELAIMGIAFGLAAVLSRTALA